jgi:hypothetical protein
MEVAKFYVESVSLEAKGVMSAYLKIVRAYHEEEGVDVEVGISFRTFASFGKGDPNPT